MKEKLHKKFTIVSLLEELDIRKHLDLLNDKKIITNWVYIIHDKDNVMPHCHVYVEFTRFVSYDFVSQYFNVHPFTVQHFRTMDYLVLFRYLMQITEYDNDNHKYLIDDIKTNMMDFKNKFKKLFNLGG